MTRTLKVKKIIKRDGRIVDFDPDKIANAIFKAAQALGGKDRSIAVKLADQVVSIVEQKFGARKVPTVEDVQDVVETVLIEGGHAKTAKAYILYRQKRKELREAKALLGVYDDLKLSLNAVKVLAARYLRKDENRRIIETPGQMFHRVAKAIAKVDLNYGKSASVKKIEEEFYNMMASLEFLPNSPTLMNAGTEIGNLSACFVLPVEDSMESIFDAVKNLALIHRSGGGTGFTFSKLRPKGDVVKTTGGVASGPISFMKVFDAATNVIKQGGRRRGANMGILRVDHPDILDFIVAKERNDVLTNFNISVAATHRFMKAVKNEEDYELINPRTQRAVKRLSAKKVFDLIVAMAWKNGEPGIIFIDRINEYNPTPEIGKIESTNPCLGGNMLLSTENGLERLSDIATENSDKGTRISTDNRVPVNANVGRQPPLDENTENGTNLHNSVRAWSTGEKVVYRLVTSAGYELVATPNHRILTTEGWIELRDCLGKKILIQSGEGIFSRNYKLPFPVKNEFTGKNGRRYSFSLPSEWSKELGFILGWAIGDGWLREGDKDCRIGFSFGDDDLEVFEHLKPILNGYYGRETKEIQRENNTTHLSYPSKFFVDYFRKLGVKPVEAINKAVPDSIFTATKEAVTGFLQALFTADGTIGTYEPSKNYYIRLTSKSRRLLKEVQLLLLNLGIKSRIYNRCRESRKGFKYVTKSGEKRSYTLDGICFELNISRENIPRFLDEVGFFGSRHEEKRRKLNRRYYSDKFEDMVTEIRPAGKAIVYDFEEPITHSGICNGIVVHNCGEQPLLPYESCNLGSINLSKMVDGGDVNWKKLGRTVELAVHFLDNVVDANKYPLPEIENMTKGNRKIGLGVMGFADMLIRLGIPYNSEKALKTAEKVMRFIQSEGKKASEELAKKRGAFPNFEKSIFGVADEPKLRNATVTTIAPTGSLSIIANCSGGIEPLFAISFVRRVMEGAELIEVNPTFDEIARVEGFYSDELMKRIAKAGSIQHVEEVPPEVRRIFVTAHDIAPEWHVKMQAAFQKYVENAVSKTANLPYDATPHDVERIFLLAYRLGCKGITVYRDRSRESQVMNIELPEAEHLGDQSERESVSTSSSNPDHSNSPDTCPVCGTKLVHQEGCVICRSCGWGVCEG
ncbi:MAG: ribonucleotide reductase N-terminal alpha domain-containing protein [Promethearchaeota archaeon]